MEHKRAEIKKRVRGQMKPLSAKQVSAIEMLLAQKRDYRSLAMFRLAIDTMFRASDIVRVYVDEITTSNGDITDEAVIRMKKTGRIAKVAISESTKEALRLWMPHRPSFWGEWLFCGEERGTHLSESQYRRLVKCWFRMIDLDVKYYSTHSLRRTKAALIFEKTGSVEIVRRLLGHASVSATSNYLGIDDADALKIAREVRI